MLAAGTILFRRERPPHDQSRTEQAEVVGTDLPRSQLFGELPSGVVHDVGAKRRRVLHDRRLLSPVGELGRRGSWSRALRRRVHEQDDLVRVRKWDGLEENRAHDGEDRCVGADTQGERGDGRARERPILAEHPKRVLQILDEQLHTTSLARTRGLMITYRHSKVAFWLTLATKHREGLTRRPRHDAREEDAEGRRHSARNATMGSTASLDARG